MSNSDFLGTTIPDHILSLYQIGEFLRLREDPFFQKYLSNLESYSYSPNIKFDCLALDVLYMTGSYFHASLLEKQAEAHLESWDLSGARELYAMSLFHRASYLPNTSTLKTFHCIIQQPEIRAFPRAVIATHIAGVRWMIHPLIEEADDILTTMELSPFDSLLWRISQLEGNYLYEFAYETQITEFSSLEEKIRLLGFEDHPISVNLRSIHLLYRARSGYPVSDESFTSLRRDFQRLLGEASPDVYSTDINFLGSLHGFKDYLENPTQLSELEGRCPHKSIELLFHSVVAHAAADKGNSNLAIEHIDKALRIIRDNDYQCTFVELIIRFLKLLLTERSSPGVGLCKETFLKDLSCFADKSSTDDYLVLLSHCLSQVSPNDREPTLLLLAHLHSRLDFLPSFEDLGSNSAERLLSLSTGNFDIQSSITHTEKAYDSALKTSNWNLASRALCCQIQWALELHDDTWIDKLKCRLDKLPNNTESVFYTFCRLLMALNTARSEPKEGYIGLIELVKDCRQTLKVPLYALASICESILQDCAANKQELELFMTLEIYLELGALPSYRIQNSNMCGTLVTILVGQKLFESAESVLKAFKEKERIVDEKYTELYALLKILQASGVAVRSSRLPRKWPSKTLMFVASVIITVFSFALIFEMNDALLLAIVVIFHELGHLWAMRYAGYQDTSILLIPFFGGIASGTPTHHEPSLFKELLISFAGPLPGIIVGLILILVIEDPLVHKLSRMLILINLINLLPIYPLDGGRISELVLQQFSFHFELAIQIFSGILLLYFGRSSPILFVLGLIFLWGLVYRILCIQPTVTVVIHKLRFHGFQKGERYPPLVAHQLLLQYNKYSKTCAQENIILESYLRFRPLSLRAVCSILLMQVCFIILPFTLVEFPAATYVELNALQHSIEAHEQEGKLKGALVLAQKALRVATDKLGTTDPKTLAFLEKLADLYQQQGRSEEAIKTYEQLMEGQSRRFGRTHPYAIRPIRIIGDILADDGDYDEALVKYRTALELYEQALIPRHIWIAGIYCRIGGVFLDQENYGEAERYYLLALENEKKAFFRNDVSIAVVLENLAFVYGEQQRYDLAIDTLTGVIDTYNKTNGMSLDSARAMSKLGDMFLLKGEDRRALSTIKEVLLIRQSSLPENHWLVEQTKSYLISVRESIQRKEKSDAASNVKP
jgi:tetratricopeptide (TPR) repeat protein